MQQQQQYQQYPVYQQQQGTVMMQPQPVMMTQQQPMVYQQQSGMQPMYVQQQQPAVMMYASQPQQPMMMTQQPTVIQQQPMMMQQPTVIQQQPMMMQQQPTVVQQQQPMTMQARPVVIQQQPMMMQQQPTVIQQQPMMMQQQPTVIQQQPMMMQARPVVIQQQQAVVPLSVNSPSSDPQTYRSIAQNLLNMVAVVIMNGRNNNDSLVITFVDNSLTSQGISKEMASLSPSQQSEYIMKLANEINSLGFDGGVQSFISKYMEDMFHVKYGACLQALMTKLKVGLQTKSPGITQEKLTFLLTPVIEKLITNSIHEMMYDMTNANHIKRLNSLTDCVVSRLVSLMSASDSNFLSVEVHQCIVMWKSDEMAKSQPSTPGGSMMMMPMQQQPMMIQQQNDNQNQNQGQAQQSQQQQQGQQQGQQKDKDGFSQGVKKGAGEQTGILIY